MEGRRAGVLLHISSLDGPDPIGDIGPSARRFLKWLGTSGFGAWQMLPIGPVGPGNSPYSAQSSFAGEPLFVSLDDLAERGWLDRASLRAARDRFHSSAARAREGTRHGRHRSEHRAGAPSTSVDWAAARRFKWPLLSEAYARFLDRGGARSGDYRRFVRDSEWLPAWCAFVERSGRSPGEAAFIQFAFDLQWRSLRRDAIEAGVALIGDLPIFVATVSADVLGNPELFRLDARGRPTVVTGVPPDDFAPTGQRWGQPHYRWSTHARDGFSWWQRRVRAATERFELLRIDHFIGFVRAYEVPAAHRTAAHGRWRATPGRRLLGAISRSVGALPLIAEDLGSVTPEVIRLRDDFGLPGMKIVQSAFWCDDAGDLPHHHPANAVVYPGTHDNDTVAGWWRTLPSQNRRRFTDYAGAPAAARSSRGRPNDAIVGAMLRLVCNSPSRLAIMPMQDLLALGSEARMNFPGRGRGQWRWRLAHGWQRSIDAAQWRRRLEVAGRVRRRKEEKS